MDTVRKTPVDGYIRVSRVGGRDNFISPELQRESILRVAERENLEVVAWFEELDASGGDNDRPLWNAAIDRVEQGETKGMVCWNLSRFSRSLKDAINALERIEDAGGKLYSEEGNLGKLDRAIRLVIAEDERDRAKAGFRNAAANAIARGVYISAKVPFGYHKDEETRRLVPDPEKAPIVEDLFVLRSKGKSWNDLIKWSSETHGLTFAKPTLSGMLSNPAYLGQARQGDLVNEKAHEPIVTRKLFTEAQAAKGRRPAFTGASKALVLRGIIGCATCGHNLMVGNTLGATQPNGKREKIPAYYCRNAHCSGKAFITGPAVDAYVVERVMAFLRFSAASVTTKTNQPAALKEAVRELESAQYALDTFKANRKAIITLGVDDWNNLLEDYVVARDVAQVEIDGLMDEAEDQFHIIAERWDEWTDESRREFLARVVKLCEVHPAGGKRNVPLKDRVDLNVSLKGTTDTETNIHGFSDGPSFQGATEVVIVGRTEGYDQFGRKLKGEQ